MADENVISQDEIEKLLRQTDSAAAPADNSAAPSGVTPAEGSVSGAAAAAAAAVNHLPRQEDKTASAATPVARPSEGNMAEKDIEFLLNQAEKALESINPSANSALPQGASAYQFQEFGGAPASADAATLDLVRDVELDLRIELGRTNMYLEDVLKLRKGSVVPLDKMAGDPVDIHVNGRLVARGEVLVLNDNFCVRVVELIAGIDPSN